MTLDDFAEKMDKRFDQVDDKLDNMSLMVAKHTVNLSGHDREIKELKDANREQDDKAEAAYKEIDRRFNKIERWMWFTLGGGAAAGAGVAKLFM